MGLALKLVAQRLSLGLLLLFAVSALIFIGVDLLPGDPARAALGQSATEDAVANLRAEMGLDRPLLTRYVEWLTNFVQGDMGRALISKADIAEQVGKRLYNTFFLAGVAAVISIPLAILLGLVAVRYRNRWPDKLISATTLASISLPEFFIGYLLILWFSVKLGWFPSVATVYDTMSFGQRLNTVMLPALTLTLVVLAHMMRMTRAAILNVLQSAYIETAELKGLGGLHVIWKHAFPNAIAPIVNVVMLNMAYLVVGVVVVEVIFTYPGMGQYLVDHVSKSDVPVVQACGLIFAAVYIGLNLVADVVSILSNPRLRHPK